MKIFYTFFFVWMLNGVLTASLIEATDADGVKRALNPTGQVTVIIYSNPSVQDRTRETGKTLDLFHGRPDFRSIVVVDLRGTMADWAAGYTVRRMVKDLDKEALRLTPVYLAKGNKKNPRSELSAVADFKGDICRQLGWESPKNQLRILVFDQKGARHQEWEDLKDYSELTKSVGTLFKP